VASADAWNRLSWLGTDRKAAMSAWTPTNRNENRSVNNFMADNFAQALSIVDC
jgi:hypothetical protein